MLVYQRVVILNYQRLLSLLPSPIATPIAPCDGVLGHKRYPTTFTGSLPRTRNPGSGEPEIQKSVRRTMIHAPESKWLSLLSQLFFCDFKSPWQLSYPTNKNGLPVSYEPALYWMVSLPIWLIDMYKYKDSMILRTTIQRLHHQPSNFGCSWELPLC